MKTKTQALTKSLADEAQKKLTKRGLSLFMSAPDFHLSAAVLTSSRFTIQDRKEFFETIIAGAGDKACPAFDEKLALLNMEYYHGRRLFANGFKIKEEKAEFLRHIHYHTWIELVVKRRVLSKDMYVKIFPEADYKATLWNTCIDETGAPRKNP